MFYKLLLTLALLLTASINNPTEAQTDNNNYSLQLERMKFKKRSSLMSRIMNDFDKSETFGYRCIVTFIFTSKEEKHRTIDPHCFYLKDEYGNVYSNLDTESEDYRSDVLTGPCSIMPNMPQKIKLTFVVPDNNKKYTVSFKGYK